MFMKANSLEFCGHPKSKIAANYSNLLQAIRRNYLFSLIHMYCDLGLGYPNCFP